MSEIIKHEQQPVAENPIPAKTVWSKPVLQDLSLEMTKNGLQTSPDTYSHS